MIFHNKQKVNGAPVWEVDTDTQTLRHRNPKTGKTERYVFHTDHIRYYLHHIEEKRPDLLQEIVDKGEIYKHLDELDTKVTDAVNRQTELLMQSSRDYQAAVMSGRIDQSGAIGNLLRMQAQRAVNETMIYLWRDESCFVRTVTRKFRRARAITSIRTPIRVTAPWNVLTTT